MNRRQFNTRLAAGLLLAGWPGFARAAAAPPVRLRIAAIQMAPRLGDVAANLAQAEALAREALTRGAQWVILPEMFTSGAAFHPDMLKAIQPLDGEPARLLQRLAREGRAVVGGSTWWTLPDDAPQDSPLRADNLKMLRDAPPACWGCRWCMAPTWAHSRVTSARTCRTLPTIPPISGRP